jgi:hypothetical protein
VRYRKGKESPTEHVTVRDTIAGAEQRLNGHGRNRAPLRHPAGDPRHRRRRRSRPD